MPAIAFGLGWLGYTVTLYGVALLKGWNITFGQMISPTKPYGSQKGQSWPPPQIGNTAVLPSDNAVSTAAKTNAKSTTTTA